MDIAEVCKVLKSDFLTQGPAVPLFEKALCNLTKVKYAVAVNSATSALHIACLALGLKKGDILWTSPISFVASANCGRYCRADIDFVDIDPKTYNMSIAALQQKLDHAEKENCLPTIVIPVHLSGQPCEMEAIHALSKKYGFSIIEDASHAIGAKYKGFPVGNCQFSDITVFSFHPVKIVTTGEGGAALTNSSNLSQKLIELRSHGITRDPLRMKNQPDGPWYYQQLSLGHNYRLTDIQAALGNSQLKRLALFIKKRQKLVNRYNKKLRNLPIDLPYQLPGCCSSFHLYIIKLQLDLIKYSQRDIFKKMLAAGINVNLHYIPIHTQPYYQQYTYNTDSLREAENYYQHTLTLPLYPDLTFDQQDTVISELKRIIA